MNHANKDKKGEKIKDQRLKIGEWCELGIEWCDYEIEGTGREMRKKRRV